jgi:hypothetical protein
MSSITLEQILAKQTELATMIEAIKSAPATTITCPAVHIELAPGEHYAGLVLDATGQPAHHLVLLPGEAESTTWQDAMDWAAKQEANLPTRQEQALLYANLKGQFSTEWYWSSEQYAASSAWDQYFNNGYQFSSSKSHEGRARAVRRLSL